MPFCGFVCSFSYKHAMLCWVSLKSFAHIILKFGLSYIKAAQAKLSSMILNGETDIGFASEQLSENDVIAAFPYYSWHYTALVPRGHPLAELPEVTLDAPSAWSLITIKQD